MLLEQGVIVICAGGGGIPTAYADEPRRAGRRLQGVEAVIDKDLASALLAIEIGADALLIVTDVDAVYADWGTDRQRADPQRDARGARASEFAAGSMGPKVRAARWFAEQTGGFAAIGSIDDTQALLRGEAGTRVALADRRPARAEKDRDGDHRTGPDDRGPQTWHVLSTRDAPGSSTSSPSAASTSDEAAARLQRYGPNRFAEAKTEPRWHAFLRQYRDPMQIVLLGAGVISIYPVKQPGTGIMILLLTLLNAVLGLNQEGKAAAAVAALAKMMIVKARVRRDGALALLPAEQLVPGDVVEIEAGDVVPADGRVLAAATLEVAEAALTGESLPVGKGVERWRRRTRRSATAPTWST